MRRGQSGVGGWRNENHRHFRPRVGGNTHFRRPRGFGLLDSPRFLPPFIDRPPPDNRYRNREYNNYLRPQLQRERSQIRPLLQWAAHKSDSNRNSSQEPSDYNDDVDSQHNKHYHVNSMGDVDHRHMPHPRQLFNRPPPIISPWNSDHPLYQPAEKGHSIYRQDRGILTKSTVACADYTGHRPPASDHYGCNPTSAIDSSNTFSRSVDDTVDIIRKRLQNRSDSQNTTDSFEDSQDKMSIDDPNLSECNSFEHKQPVRKRFQRQPVNKTNCVNIKNKIVHQLFKMDKEKIHKLMDNPNSSSKFEYAISSLITESQNSYNRHLRSAAEKSLCGSSTEFIENDNNTIYEDTFMKQMQCMLDPQDTVFLEDIKPFVMAEITKVLQLNEYDQNCQNMGDDFTASDSHYEHQNYYQSQSQNNGPKDEFSTEDYSMENSKVNYYRPQSVEPEIKSCNRRRSDSNPKPAFDRRHRTKSLSYAQDRCADNTYYRRESKERSNEDINRPPNLFVSSEDHISEEEDPFEELDKQYHVAVDHDFIERDDISNIKQEESLCNSNYTNIPKIEPISPEKIIDRDIEIQVQDMARSSLKLSASIIKEEAKHTLTHCNEEPSSSANSMPLRKKNSNNISCQDENTKKKDETESKETFKDVDKKDLSSNLKSISSNSRRSVDQRPAHRKEKRKKSESCATEANKQILNKNIIINVNDCSSKASDKCESSKSIFNLYFSKDNSKPVLSDSKNSSPDDKNCTDKHVKKKETPKNTVEKDGRSKRSDSTVTSNLTSPTENNNIFCDTPNKVEAKNILKPIDMFNEQPKKSNIHQAHRNTAPAQSATPKIEMINKNKAKDSLCKRLAKKHVAVQVISKVHAKQTQTPPLKCSTQCCPAKKKYSSQSTQTEINSPCKSEKSSNKSTNTFERMKEIDLEIQVLLQEKFKLYSSIENNDSKTMQTLGMTILNVSPYNAEEETAFSENATSTSEDTIVSDFANIPVDELEQIAMETIEEHEDEKSNQSKRSRRSKLNREPNSQSPVTIQTKKSKKRKSPNISLIEQIISDNRPLEDIIELDQFEVPESKCKNKKAKISKPKLSKRKITPKSKLAKLPNSSDSITKECYVIVERIDMSPYLKPVKEIIVIQNEPNEINHTSIVLDTDRNNYLNNEYSGNDNFHEETVVNDIQFDMLDVSEDIVVGDVCEVKSLDDKEEVADVSICEEIILDNSQSSVEDTPMPAASQGLECKMYDYSADENLRRDSVVVGGNADAVLALECVENNFVAACLDGNVYYFNNEGQLLTTLRGSNLAVTCLTIVKEKYGTTVYTGSLDSRIRYYDLESGLEKGPECNVLSPIQTMDRAWDTVFVGTRTGFVLQFECKNNMLIPVSTVKFSDQSILALRAMKEGPRKVLLVAARSENVTIKDAQSGLLLRTLEGPKMTVYSLLYEDGKVYCGTSSQQIHVFDYASGSHCGAHVGGKGCVCLRAAGGLLLAGCYDGCVYVYREGEEQPFAQLRGPSLMLLSLTVVGTKIIAGYKDRSLYIWKIPLNILKEMIL